MAAETPRSTTKRRVRPKGSYTNARRLLELYDRLRSGQRVDLDAFALELGVSTRSVDDLVRAMGMEGISKSGVSRLCAEIDGRVGDFLARPSKATGPTFGSTRPT